MDYKKLLPPREQNSYKGTFGKILNIAGSYSFQGAAYLSSVAALRMGAGYVTLACPEWVVDNVASLTPDVTFLPLCGEVLADVDIVEQNLHRFDVILIGCGLGLSPRRMLFVEKILDLLADTTMPVIIDADALNAIAKCGIKKLPTYAVITPHEAEMARLLRCSIDDVACDRESCAKEASQQYGCVTVLKGNKTIISSVDGDLVINETGNSALAKAGSGDVLAGIVAGLAAQGCCALDAAILGVYLHGLCGDMASARNSEYSVLASDLLEYIPRVVTNFLQNSNFSD